MKDKKLVKFFWFRSDTTENNKAKTRVGEYDNGVIRIDTSMLVPMQEVILAVGEGYKVLRRYKNHMLIHRSVFIKKDSLHNIAYTLRDYKNIR